MAPSRAPGTTSGRDSEDSTNLAGSAELEARSQLPVEEEDGYYHHHQPSTRKRRWSQLLDNLGLMSIRQRHTHSYEPGSFNPKSSGKTEYRFNGPRPSTIWVVVKQACIVVPLITLMIFGLLHVMQVLIGRASLLWDIDHDTFWPTWGMSGHLGSGLDHYPTDITRDIAPKPVHSHNDYWRTHPLFDALRYGCIGVEADVWHFDDDLYVGHNTAALTRNRTFRSLYIDPLVTILDAMNPKSEFGNTRGHGVWDTDAEQELVLLVDLKTDGKLTLPIVEQQLQPLRSKGYLTYFDGEKVVPGAVTVVGTGNTPFDMLVSNKTYRDIFFDAPLDRLWEAPKSYLEPEEEGGSPEPRTVKRGDGGQGNSGLSPDTPSSAFNRDTSYYASIDFSKAVGTIWRGHLTPRQIHVIRGQINGAKKHGLKARYWNTPVWPISLRNHVWHVLIREGADMLNADDLKAATRQNWKTFRHEWW